MFYLFVTIDKKKEGNNSHYVVIFFTIYRKEGGRYENFECLKKKKGVFNKNVWKPLIERNDD